MIKPKRAFLSSVTPEYRDLGDRRAVSMSLNPPTRIIFLRRKKSSSLPVKITDFLLKSLCPLTLVSSGALISHWKFGEYTSLYPYEFMDHYFARDSQPGFYSDIGRKARDLLFEDFPVCSKFRLDKHPFSAYLTHQNDLLAVSPNDIFLGEGQFSWSVKSVTNEFTIRTNSTLAFKSTINQIAFGVLPGLSAVSEFDTAIANSGKLEVQFMHDYASFKASIGGLFHDTNIGVSSVIGTKNLSLGLDLLLHTNNLNVTKFDGAFAYTTAERRTSSIAMNEMAHVLVASYHQVVNSDTSFGAQFRYSFIDQVPVLTLGVEHRLDPHLWLKARADNTGQVSAIFQWYFMRVLGEFRPAYLPRIGLGIALSF